MQLGGTMPRRPIIITVNRSAILHRLHKELWEWLAKNQGSRKKDWPGLKRIGNNLVNKFNTHNECFACIYCRHDDKDTEGTRCRHCPIQWNNGKTCFDREAEYREWYNARQEDNYELEAEMAETIANLKWKR